jgi:hypothetical protein
LSPCFPPWRMLREEVAAVPRLVVGAAAVVEEAAALGAEGVLRLAVRAARLEAGAAVVSRLVARAAGAAERRWALRQVA